MQPLPPSSSFSSAGLSGARLAYSEDGAVGGANSAAVVRTPAHRGRRDRPTVGCRPNRPRCSATARPVWDGSGAGDDSGRGAGEVSEEGAGKASGRCTDKKGPW